jgi:iron complex transport system ATP-binding protein
MIEIKDISFSYPDADILKQVGFTAESGEVVGLLGNNGAGKSTLVTCLNRIRTPKSGSLHIDGKNAFQMGRNELARTVAYVAQKNELTHSTVFDCVLLGRKPYIKWSVSQEDLDICTRIMERVGLLDYQMRYVDELSGGELQKVMLARALVAQPKLLLLDEPTSNLDPKNQYEMMALVRELAREQGITVITVIHDLNLALRFCDKFYFLKAGEGYSYGGLDTVTPETLQAVYGIRAEVLDVGGRKTVIID